MKWSTFELSQKFARWRSRASRKKKSPRLGHAHADAFYGVIEGANEALAQRPTLSTHEQMLTGTLVELWSGVALADESGEIPSALEPAPMSLALATALMRAPQDATLEDSGHLLARVGRYVAAHHEGPRDETRWMRLLAAWALVETYASDGCVRAMHPRTLSIAALDLNAFLDGDVTLESRFGHTLVLTMGALFCALLESSRLHDVESDRVLADAWFEGYSQRLRKWGLWVRDPEGPVKLDSNCGYEGLRKQERFAFPIVHLIDELTTHDRASRALLKSLFCHLENVKRVARDDDADDDPPTLPDAREDEDGYVDLTTHAIMSATYVCALADVDHEAGHRAQRSFEAMLSSMESSEAEAWKGLVLASVERAVARYPTWRGARHVREIVRDFLERDQINQPLEGRTRRWMLAGVIALVALTIGVLAWTANRGALFSSSTWPHRDVYSVPHQLGAEAQSVEEHGVTYDESSHVSFCGQHLVPETTSLECHDARVHDLEPLRGLTSLETLNLDGTDVVDLSPLSSLHTIRTLSLRYTQVESVSSLSELHALKTLDMGGAAVVDIEGLEGLEALQHLDLGSTQVVDISVIAGLEGLMMLDLEATPVEDFSSLAALKNLEGLDLRNTRFSTPELLANLTQLTNLDLEGTHIASLKADHSNVSPNVTGAQPDPLEALAELTSMKALDLEGLSVQNIQVLANLTSLEALDLKRTEVENLAPLSGLAELRSLDLRHTPVQDLAPLGSLDTLEQLDLEGTRVTSLDALTGLSRLRKLDLEATDIDDLSPLSGMDLHILILEDTKVNSIEVLASMTNLRALNLRGTPLTSEDVEDLRQALPDCDIEWRGSSTPIVDH